MKAERGGTQEETTTKSDHFARLLGREPRSGGQFASGAGSYTSSMKQVLQDSPSQRHQELLVPLLEDVAAYNPELDRELLERAFLFASEAHEGQQRRSGEPFVAHPVGVARVLADLHLDDSTLAAALLHDVVEDTNLTIEEVRAEFGEEITRLVEGVTKLTRIHFQSREQAQAENYRKMIVAMAQDPGVILIKLADRLHNMRTIEYLGKQKQLQKARETLEVYAPLAHRLGIHTIKWQLEDLAFATLHPRRYAEIQAMVNERRGDRDEFVSTAAEQVERELEKLDIPAEISGRAKHFYSIYEKMAKRGKEFNEIYDLTAMRVIVQRDGKEGERDCYGALGIIHSLWKPMPGPVQGLRRDAQVQSLSLAPHDGDRAGGEAARDPGADERHARNGRVRDRRPLGLQGLQAPRERGRANRLARAARRLAGGGDRPTASSSVRSRSSPRTRSTSSRRRARSRISRPARRRSTSRTQCTPMSATEPWARR